MRGERSSKGPFKFRIHAANFAKERVSRQKHFHPIRKPLPALIKLRKKFRSRLATPNMKCHNLPA